VIRVMARRFGESNYSLQSLFRDEQRKVLETIFQTDLEEAEALYRQIYERRAPIMRFLTGLNIPLPKGFAAAAEVVLNSDLRRWLGKPVIDAQQVIKIIDTAKTEGVTLDSGTLEFAFRRSLEHAASRFAAEPSPSTLGDFQSTANLLQYLPFPVDLWTVQNIFYEELQKTYPAQVRAAAHGHEAARGWIRSFTDLGNRLGIKVL